MMRVTHNAEDGKRFPYSNPPCSWYCVDLEDDVDPGQYNWPYITFSYYNIFLEEIILPDREDDVDPGQYR